MDKELIIKEIKSQLTGNRLQDYHFLKAKMDELAKSPETIEAARALAPFMMDVIRPDEIKGGGEVGRGQIMKGPKSTLWN